MMEAEDVAMCLEAWGENPPATAATGGRKGQGDRFSPQSLWKELALPHLDISLVRPVSDL